MLAISINNLTTNGPIESMPPFSIYTFSGGLPRMMNNEHTVAYPITENGFIIIILLFKGSLRVAILP